MLFGLQEFIVGVAKVAENLEPLSSGGGLHFHDQGESRRSALLPKASSCTCSRRFAMLFGVVVIQTTVGVHDGYIVFFLMVPSIDITLLLYYDGADVVSKGSVTEDGKCSQLFLCTT
jgi:hypothetical protein